MRHGIARVPRLRFGHHRHELVRRDPVRRMGRLWHARGETSLQRRGGVLALVRGHSHRSRVIIRRRRTSEEGEHLSHHRAVRRRVSRSLVLVGFVCFLFVRVRILGSFSSSPSGFSSSGFSSVASAPASAASAAASSGFASAHAAFSAASFSALSRFPATASSASSDTTTRRFSP